MMNYMNAAGFPSIWDGICSGSTCSITSADDILKLVANLIRVVLAIGGAASVVVVIVGGIFYVISSGQPARIKRARDIITNAIIGLVIATLSYTIVTFIAGRF